MKPVGFVDVALSYKAIHSLVYRVLASYTIYYAQG